jgi:hypothetical protein
MLAILVPCYLRVSVRLSQIICAVTQEMTGRASHINAGLLCLTCLKNVMGFFWQLVGCRVRQTYKGKSSIEEVVSRL